MRQRAAAPALALRVAVLPDRLELGLELVDSSNETTPVDFKLRLARAARSDARCPRRHAARLLGQLRAFPAESRQPVLQQRELDLGLAFLAVRVLSEDVEDHGGAIDGRSPEQLLEVELLRGRELVVEHNRVRVDRQRDIAQFVDLALTDVRGRVRSLATLHHPRDLVGTGGVNELRQLIERCLDVIKVVTAERDADEHELLALVPGDEGVGECVVH